MFDRFSRSNLFMGPLVLMVMVLLGSSSIRPTLAEPAQPTANYCLYLPIVLAADSGSAGPIGSGAFDCSAQPEATDVVDFNNDGYADLAIGAPEDDFSAFVQDSGSVTVLYGTADGLASANEQLLTQNTSGGFSEAGELFGMSVTAADFNGDNYTDLAIGSPGEEVEGIYRAGQVTVLYGSISGLLAEGNQTFSQGVAGIQGIPEDQDRFGDTLTSGDYNGDGYADLVVGAPLEDYEADSLSSIGAVNVIYGSETGLVSTDNRIIHQAQAEVDGTASWNGRFGYALETGDFNADGLDDLAVGVPGYDLATTNDVGVVEVFYGSDDGVSVLGEQLWRQGIGGLPGAPEEDDAFGTSLAVGDFDNNGADDLAIGVFMEDVTFEGDTHMDAGAVHILYGYALTNGLTATGSQLWHQGLAEIVGNPIDFDYFGRALVAADFNGDGADDLAVGVSGESSAANVQGMVQVFYSNGSLLSTANQDLWLQDMLGGVGEEFDFFGERLGTADFNGDGFSDLAVGVPSETIVVDVFELEDAGEVNVVYGQESGLGAMGSQVWRPGVAGIPGILGVNDGFGHALTR